MNETIKMLADKSGRLMALINEAQEETRQFHDALIRMMIKGKEDIEEPDHEKFNRTSPEGSF